MYFFSTETMTDAVMSDLVQRNAKFSCEGFTGLSVAILWTHKTWESGSYQGQTCVKNSIFYLTNKQKQWVFVCQSEEHFCKCSLHSAQFQVFSM